MTPAHSVGTKGGTSVVTPKSALKEAVERATARMRAYRPTNEWGDPVRHMIVDEATDLIERLSATLEAMASALTVVRCMAENAAYNLHQMGISQETASPARAFEDIESQARTTLTQYRQGDL